MFSRWGAFVYRFRRPIVVLAILLAVAASTLAVQASSAMSSGGWLDANSESAAVAARLDAEFGAGKSSVIALFRSSDPALKATSDEFQAAIATATAGLKTDPMVTRVIGYAETGDTRFISTAGDAAYVIVELDATDEESVELVDQIRAAIQPPAGFTYQLTGYGPITKDGAALSEKDLQKAEIVSLPIAAVVLILVFASLIAAGMPLLVAGLAIPTSLALIYLVAQQVEMSIYVLNIATMLGLALAIDYSLFIVSRFREECAVAGPWRSGRTIGATAGKAVAFSGIAVAIGLSGPAPVRGAGHPLDRHRWGARRRFSVVFALTFLPAMLGMLGHRVNALSLVASSPIPPDHGRRRGRPERALGACRPRGHAPADHGPHPDPGLPPAPGQPVPAHRTGRSGAESTRPASRVATRTSPSRPSSRRARPHRS